MGNQLNSAIDSLLGKLSNEGWAHNNQTSLDFLETHLPAPQSSLIDFSARKLPQKTKLVIFSLEQHYYEAHRLLRIAAKRPQIWINVDYQLSFWKEIEVIAQEKFLLRDIDEKVLLLIPNASTHWLSTLTLPSDSK